MVRMTPTKEAATTKRNEEQRKRPEVYDRLAGEDYDDSPWDPDEMDRLREEAVDLLDCYGSFPRSG